MNPPEPSLSLDLTHVADELYGDAVADTLKEASKVGVDLVKVCRLVLFPIQYAAMYQDKLAQRLKRAVDNVPEKDRGNPNPALTLQVAEKLKPYIEDDLISEMYVRLLSLSFDKRQFGKAHPAFVNIISQLCADEAVLISTLADEPPMMYVGREPLPWAQSMASLRSKPSQHGIHVSDEAWRRVLNPDLFAQPNYIQTFIQHLQSLGVLEFVNQPEAKLSNVFRDITNNQCWQITLTAFGRLFHEACMFEPISATEEDRL